MSVILIALAMLALSLAFVLILSPLIAEQWATIAALLGEWYQEAYRSLIQSPSLLVRRIARQFPSVLPLTLSTGQPLDPVTAVDQLITIGREVLRTVLVVGATVLLIAMWIQEGERISRIFMLALPRDRRESVREFFAEAGEKVGAYTRGLAILTLMVGVLSGIAHFIIGLPNAFLLGLLAGIFELIPLVGPTLGAIPALLVAVSVDPSKVPAVIIAVLIIQALENNVIAPRVMDKAVGVNPVASLLAFLTFGSLFGFVGALLAIPLAAVVQIIVGRLFFNVSANREQPAPANRDAVSMLRYEAQDLAQDVRKQVREKSVELESGVDDVEDSIEAVVQDLDSILAELEKSRDDNNGSNQP